MEEFLKCKVCLMEKWKLEEIRIEGLVRSATHSHKFNQPRSLKHEVYCSTVVSVITNCHERISPKVKAAISPKFLFSCHLSINSHIRKVILYRKLIVRHYMFHQEKEAIASMHG